MGGDVVEGGAVVGGDVVEGGAVVGCVVVVGEDGAGRFFVSVNRIDLPPVPSENLARSNAPGLVDTLMMSRPDARLIEIDTP